MKNRIFILIVTIVGLVVVSVLSRNWANKNTPSQELTSQTLIYQSQIDEKGAVTIKVTPKELVPGKKAQFSLVFDTHSVELDGAPLRSSDLR